MDNRLQILHLEDDPLDVALVKAVLEAECLECDVVHVSSAADFEAALARKRFDIVLSDYSLPGYDGFTAMRTVMAKHKNIPFIIVSGTLGEEQAIESMQSGATDYVLKQRLSRLVPAIRRAVAEAKAKEEAARSEHQLREQAALLDQARDAICVTDMDQQILYWNKSAERLYGWTAAEAVGKNANDLLFQGDLAAPLQALKTLIRKNEWQGELEQVTKSRAKLIVESRWTLLRDDNGAPKSMLVINTDITERKQMEAQFLRTQRMETIGALAGGIAHDLNNMLAPILIAVELLRNEQSPENKDILEMVGTSAQRGADMVKQILSFARGASGEHGLTDIKHIIKDMARLAKDTFPRSIRIERSITPDLWRVNANATQLHQVLLNLCVNARDAMPNGGVLKISADNVQLAGTISQWKAEPVSGPHLRLSVTDTGVGIAPDLLPRLFDPFFTTKEADKGTGLGLSTVMGIVKHHGGFVDVRSEVGKGSTFTVYLPASVAAAAAITTAKAEMPDGHGEQVLVVDDEAPLLEMTRLMLEAHNYRVLTATDGAMAMHIYQQHRNEIHVVLTDLMMPVMDGATLIRELQKVSPSVKVICISGLGSSAYRLSTHGLHIAGSLQKPYAADDLLRMLRNVIHVDLAA